MNALSAFLVLAALFGIYRTWSTWPLDIIGIFCLDVVLFYGFRVAAVGFGFDAVYPEYLFAANPPVVQANAVIFLFLACVALGLFLGGNTTAKATWIFPSFRGQLSVQRGMAVSALLTGAATAITLFLMARYGGAAGLIRAGKLERDLAGLFFLRMIPGLGAMVASATFLELVRRRRGRFTTNQRLVAAGCATMALINGAWVFAWGARSLLAIVIFLLLAGFIVFRSNPSTLTSGRTRRRQLWVGLSVVLLVAAGSIVGLRFARDLASRGEVNTTIADQSVVRQVSVASNATYYDALVLAVRDWPDTNEFRGGDDFKVGVLGIVPRALWADKPDTIVPGAWFRQVYEPTVRNGWPSGAAGEWYLNFGLLGVAFGGILSGLCLSFASRSLTRSQTSPMVFVTTVIIGLQVLELGFNTQTPLRWVAWCLPLLLVAPFVRLRPTARRSSSVAAAPAAAAAEP